MVRFTDSSFFSALSLVVVCSAIIEHSPLLAGTRFGILAADTRVSANTNCNLNLTLHMERDSWCLGQRNHPIVAGEASLRSATGCVF